MLVPQPQFRSQIVIMRLFAFIVTILLVSGGVSAVEHPVELLPVQASDPIEDVDYMGNSKAAVTEELFGGAPQTPLVNPKLTLYRVNGIISGDDTPSQQYLQPNDVQQAPVSSYVRNLGKDVDDSSMDVDPADVQRALRIAGRAETNSLRVARRARIYQRRTKNRMDGMDRSNREFRQRITGRANGIDDRVSALNNQERIFEGQTRSKFGAVADQVQGLNRAVAGFSVVRDTVIRQGQRIDKAKARANGISSQVGNLEAVVARARSKISNLVTRINTMNQAAASNSADTSRRIDSLKNRIAQLKAAGVSAAQLSYTQISSLQTKIRDMGLDSIHYRQQVANSMKELISNIKDLRASINAVKSSTADAVAHVSKMRGPQGPPGYCSPNKFLLPCSTIHVYMVPSCAFIHLTLPLQCCRLPWRPGQRWSARQEWRWPSPNREVKRLSILSGGRRWSHEQCQYPCRLQSQGHGHTL
jgi:outer membrane murein-binding lipoprotein Lpp